MMICDKAFSASKYLEHVNVNAARQKEEDYIAAARPEGPTPIMVIRLIAPDAICVIVRYIMLYI